MARTRSISSIDAEIMKIEEELNKVRRKQESLEDQLLKLQKVKQEKIIPLQGRKLRQVKSLRRR